MARALCFLIVLRGTFAACPDSSTTCAASGAEGDAAILLQTPVLVSKEEGTHLDVEINKADDSEDGEEDEFDEDDGDDTDEEEAGATMVERAVSGGGAGSKKACRTCKKGLSLDKKKGIRAFCKEMHGKGRKNRKARRQCIRKAKKEECSEQCTYTRSLLEEEIEQLDESENDDLGVGEDEDELDGEDGDDNDEEEAGATMLERAVSGGGTGSKKACRTCKKGLSLDKKKGIRAFCKEMHGKGRKNKKARRQCIRKAKKEECSEECTYTRSLLEEEIEQLDESENDDLGDGDHQACRDCRHHLQQNQKKTWWTTCETLHKDSAARLACVTSAKEQACAKDCKSSLLEEDKVTPEAQASLDGVSEVEMGEGP